jgi:hypothetical protein
MDIPSKIPSEIWAIEITGNAIGQPRLMADRRRYSTKSQ